MALFGSLATIRQQLVRNPALDAGLAYIEACFRAGSPEQARLAAMAAGTVETIELAHGAFAMEQVYFTKPREQARWESHRRCIDLQAILVGEERIEVVDIAALTITEDCTPAKDVIFYGSFGPASELRVNAGGMAVFFPVDGHLPTVMPGTVPGLIRKTVVKVPVAF